MSKAKSVEVVLDYPSSPYSNTVNNPRFKVKNVKPGDTVKLTDDPTCNVIQLSGVAQESEITFSPIFGSEITFTLYYMVESAGKSTGCLKSSVNYSYDLTAPVLSSFFTGSWGRGAGVGVSTSANILAYSVVENGSGIDRFNISIGTTCGGTDVLGWTDYGPLSDLLSTGLTLTYGTSYCTNLRIVDRAGNISGAMSSTMWKSAWKTIPKNAYPTGAVKAVVKDLSGGLLVAGDFNGYSEKMSNAAVVVNRNGDLSSNYKFLSFFGWSDVGYAAVQLSNGKLLVGGPSRYKGISTKYLNMFNADGSFDLAFFNNIGTGLTNSPRSMAVQNDGKIIIVGDFPAFNGSAHARIVRINPDGTNDNAFIGGAGFNSVANSVALQSNGSIVVGGSYGTYNGSVCKKLLRFTSAGVLDSIFDTNIGSGPNSAVNAIAVQADDKIIVGGIFSSFNSNTKSFLVRLNSDGTEDTSFRTNMGTGFTGTAINAVAIQTDGKILVGGQITSFNGNTVYNIARLNSDGSWDSSFAPNINSVVRAINFDSLESKIYVGGSFTSVNSSSRNSFVGLDLNGNLLPELNIGNGFRRIINPSVNSIVKLQNNEIFVGGFFENYKSAYAGRLVRYDSSGQLDESFVSNLGVVDNAINAMAVQPDGKIVIGGAFTTVGGNAAAKIARLNADGSFDSSYITGTGFDFPVNALVLQSDGKVVVGGNFTNYAGTVQNYITRINSDGSRDASYLTSTGFSAAVKALAIQADDKVIAGGNFTNFVATTTPRIARINTDGSYDSAFAVGTQGFNNTVQSLSIDSSGNILVGGDFTQYKGISQNYLVRLLSANANKDATFSGTGPSSVVTSVRAASDGNIYVAGSFATFNGTVVSQQLVRVSTGGTLDTSFAPGFSGITNSPTVIHETNSTPLKLVVGGDIGSRINDQLDAFITEITP